MDLKKETENSFDFSNEDSFKEDISEKENDTDDNSQNGDRYEDAKEENESLEEKPWESPKVIHDEEEILSSSNDKIDCDEQNVSCGAFNHCDICGKRFSSKRLIAKHMCEHKNNPEFERMLECTQAKTFPCSECPWAFSSFSGLQEHSLRVHDEKKQLEKNHTVKRHERNRISRLYPSRVVVKQYQCNICKISFNNRNERRLHSTVHSSKESKITSSDDSPKSCEICGKTVSQVSCMQFSGNGDTQNVGACFDCELQYRQLSKRKRGRRAGGEKLFLCEVCGNRFHTLSNLERHNKVHTGEKPFECKLCDKSYAYMHALKQHYRMHTQEKPYNCEFCGKAFARRDYLKEHLRVHTKEKPYVCKVCGRGFSQGGSLKLHQKVHARPDEF